MHPIDDPLWDTDEVIALVTIKEPVTEAEQKERNKKRNQLAYQKSVQEMQTLRAQLMGFVAANKMTQDEMDSVMLSRLHGQYRMRYREEILKRKKAEDEQRLAEVQGECERDKVAYEQLQTRTQQLRSQALNYKEHAMSLTYNLTAIFNPHEFKSQTNHLRRNGIVWPEVPSPQAFYMIYAISVPVACWPPDGSPRPELNHAFQSAILFLHPDKAFQYTDALGGEDRMNDIVNTFQASRDMIKEYMESSKTSVDEKSQLLNSFWEFAKYQVLKAMRPNSSTIPAFFISYLIDDAAAKLPQSNEQSR
jgi:hypothetical protein